MGIKKILFVANIHNHFNTFHVPFIKWLKEEGHEVHCAANGDIPVRYVDKQFEVPIQRKIFSLKNLTALRELKKIIEINDYDLVHCHTSLGGAIARLAAAKNRRRSNTKVLFTSHEFPFYENWAKLNWFTYYPIEIILSHLTDGIVSINEYDFNILNRSVFKCKRKYKINSIGIDIDKYKNLRYKSKEQLRTENEISNNQFVAIYAAEHTKRKNHKFIIDCVEELVKEANVLFVFTGRGELLESNKDYVRAKRLENHIIFTGYVDNIGELMSLADLGVSSSFGEGIGMNLVEELLLGLPVVASNNKGHREVVIEGVNGFMFDIGDKDKFIKAFTSLATNKDLYDLVSSNTKKSANKFSLDISIKQMSKIYRELIS